MQLHNISDVFFDLDHTLWDFEKNSAITFKRIFEEYQIDVHLETFLGKYVPINHSYWKLYREEKISKEELRYGRLKKSFDLLEKEITDSKINELAVAYVKYLPEQLNLFDNTITILDYLKPKYNLHIITNGFKEVQSGKLENTGISRYFNQVVNSETVGVKKPNPLIFEYALQKANTTPESSVMIGDTLEADIMGAKNVGMQAIHFNSNDEENHNHSIIINDLLSIKKYL